MNNFIKYCLFFLICTYLLIRTQPQKVQAAYNNLRMGNLEKALSYIEEAAAHPSSKDMAKTHFYRGKIYSSIYVSEKKEFDNLRDSALFIAYESYKKADSIGSKLIDPEEMEQDLKNLADLFIHYGIKKFNERKYDTSYKAFSLAKEIKEKYNLKDPIAYFFAGHSLFAMEKYSEAIPFLEKAREAKYSDTILYVDLALSYAYTDNPKKVIESIKECINKHPDYTPVIRYGLKILYEKKMIDEAMTFLESIIDKYPTASNYWLLGKFYMEKGNMTKAIELWEISLQKDSNLFESNYDLGAIYFNKGVEFVDSANTLPVGKLDIINSLMEQANNHFRKSLPYMERAYALNPKDQATAEVLLKLYARLNIQDKYQQLKEQMNKQ